VHKWGRYAMEDHFKQDDEITLAGVARQDKQLYGDTDTADEGLFKMFFSGLRDAISRVFGGSPEKEEGGK